MTNEAEAREVHATDTSSEDAQEQVNGDQAQRPDLPDEDDEIVDPDAVIVEAEVVPVEDADDEDDDDDEDEDDQGDEDELHPDTVPASAAAGAVTPADSAPADSTPDDATAVPVGSVAGRHALDETPPDGIVPVPAPSGPVPAPSAGPVPSPSAPVPGATRPGLPHNTDVTAPTDMAGDPEQLHDQWAAIQSTFVDDPHGSVVAAADLVTGAIAALVASVEEQERGLRGEWDRDGVDTEGLRNALRGYRGLLDRLVTH